MTFRDPSPLVAALTEQAAQRPEQLAYRHRAEGGDDAATITYRQLDGRVTALAETIRAATEPGDRLILSLPPGLDYVVGFLACLSARVVAVPLQPRYGIRSGSEDLLRHPLVVDAGAVAALTDAGIVDLRRSGAQAAEPESDLAFLQYTSGSTGAPKGVMVTHANLAHNVAAICEGMAIHPGDRAVVWLPPYHDMGLIGGILAPLWAGIPVTLLDPQVFARRPLTWLETISAERATLSGGPNFAFDACVDRISPKQRALLDLSSWEVAFAGAEPVRPRTLERFAEAFAVAGFRQDAFYPCYGLAEATLVVTGGRRGGGVRREGGQGLVSCGTALGGQSLAVVDPESGSPLPADTTGEVVVRGPSVTRGYWRNEAATAGAFGAEGWLRTGDLGRVVDGELYISGRRKDSLVIRGRNLFPEDIEEVARSAEPALAGAAAAAFGVDGDGEEHLAVLVEITGRHEEEHAATLARVRGAVVAASGVRPSAVALVRRGGLPRTTSGKIRRSVARALYLGQGLPVLAEERLQGNRQIVGMPPRSALAELDPADRPAALLASVRAWVAAVSGATVPRSAALVETGLDSLTLAQLQGDIAARLGVELSLRELYEAPSLEALAETIDARMDGEPVPEPAVAVSRDTVATAGQLGTWYLEQLHPGTSMHVLARAFRVLDTVDVEIVESVVRLLVDRHVALRTSFEVRDGVAEPKVAANPSVRLTVVDAVAWQDSEVDEFVRDEAVRPFDLSSGALLRATLLRQAGSCLLVLAVHHAAVDLWSVSLLLAEFAEAYRAMANGEVPALPVPGEVASQGAGPHAEELRRWWADTLGQVHPVLALPVDRARLGPPKMSTGLVTRELPETSAGQVRRLAVMLGTSRFTVLLAALKAVLAGYEGNTEITVGTPAAGRRRPKARSVVGFLANPLPLRTNVAGDPTFADLVTRVHTTTLAALDHQELPFTAVVEAAGASRTDGHNPLFDVLFVVHQPPWFAPEGVAELAIGVPGAAVTLGGLTLRSVAVPTTDSPVDLTVEVAQTAEGMIVALKYARDAFDEATADAILDAYTRTLRTALANPERRISELIAGEPGQVTPLPDRATTFDIVTRVRVHAARTPDAVALRQGSDALTYRGLLAASARLARHLRALGVGPDARVGVALPRTPDLVVTLLAVLQAGGAYCPVDLSLPPTRLAAVVEDAQPVVVVSRSASADRLPPGGHLVLLDDDETRERVAAQPAEPLDGVIHPEQLAYVLFTSGSTGRPKSVALAHRGVAALVEWGRVTYSPEELASVLAGTPLTFDMSVFELFVTLAMGGTVVLAKHTLDLPRLAEREHVTLVSMVPSLAAELLADGFPASVRTVNLGGEPVSRRLVADLVDRGASRVLNLYGPTEDTMVSSGTDLDPGDDRLMTIGWPVPGTAGPHVDGAGRFLGPGMDGELLVTGSKLARGYLRRPALTAARFVPDPAGDRPGGRAYRTGDTVRRRPDGALVYLGRADHQVKVRGVRVELEEIEAAIGSHAGVREVAVRLHNAGRADAGLIAYVVGDVPATELRTHAAGLLPPAMVPRDYVWVEGLPRMSSDKLDRAALEALAQIASGAWEPDLSRELTETERLVTAEWAEVLGVEDPDPDDDFFLHGGHSLLAMRILGRIEARTGVRVPLQRLFDRPTIAGLVACVDAGKPRAPGGGHAEEPPATAALSLTQERFWLIHSLDPRSAAYHIPAVVHLRGPLDVTRLEEALRAVVDRHDGLRTAFPMVDGEPCQRVSPSLPARLPATDAADEDEAAEIAIAEARRPFDLEAGPPWRVRLLRLAEDDHRLVFVAHHVICDGWSLELLARDLGTAYTTGRSLPPPSGSFLEWANAERAEWAVGGRGDLAWWCDRLRDLPDLRLPLDRPHRSGAAAEGATVRRSLSGSTTAALDGLARQESTTRFAVLSAVAMAVLGLHSGQDRFGVGTPVAARTSAATAELFGCVANTIVLRADLSGKPSFRELLRRTRVEVLDAVAHQGTPFARVVRELADGRALATTPLFQVVVADQPTTVDVRLAGIRTLMTPVDTATVKFDLSILIEPGPDDAVTLALQYDTRWFDDTTVSGVADRLVRLADRVGADPDLAVHALDLTVAADHEALRTWGAGSPAPELAGIGGLHEAVLAQAARTPDRVALSAPDGSVTYAALASRVRRLAAGLRNRGMVAEDRVAICHEPTAQLAVVVLGVLAAGGAYVPLRLTDPGEWRAAVLADSGARLVLCDQETASWLDTWDVPVATVADVVAEADDRAVPTLADHRQLAAVQYTVDAAGRPKGVAITHQGALARTAWARQAFSDAEPLDLALLELLTPLSTGGTAVLVGSGVAPDWDRVTCLESLTVTGAASAGRPLPGTRVSIVNSVGMAVPPGAFGEITVSEAGLARGYLGRPGPTAASFLPDPAGTAGERVFRTGGRGRWTAGGLLRTAGRFDTRVEIQGRLVDPRGVEGVVLALSGVAEAAVLADGDQLTAYVRLDDDAGDIDASDIRAGVRRRLPDHLIPAAFVVVDALPRVGTGELDRAALARRRDDSSGPAGEETPRAGIETEIAGIWRELLGVDQITRRDRFFGLGGDSLLAARMTTRLRDRFGPDLSLGLIFEDDRLVSFAKEIESMLGSQVR